MDYDKAGCFLLQMRDKFVLIKTNAQFDGIKPLEKETI
jgi:hypothetical protein